MARIALKPGENSIGDVTPFQESNGSWVVQWSIRLNDGKLLPPRKTRSKTVGEARRKAKAKAAELLMTGGNTGKYRPTDALTLYIEDVSKRAIQNSTLRDRTKDRYAEVLRYLLEEFQGYSIADSMRFRTIEEKLLSIAAKHGSETARQAKNVFSKYVVQQLVRDDLIQANPLPGMKIDLTGHDKKIHPHAGVALTSDEYERVLNYLLALDPADGVEKPKRGPYSLEHRIAVRRNAIDLTLLQMVTGLRIIEALTLDWDKVTVKDSIAYAHISEQLSKTHKSRTIPMLDSQVQEHLLKRKAEISSQLVIGSPAKPNGQWDKSNANEAVRRLFREVSDVCEVPLLAGVSSHVWRHTLNAKMQLEGVPEAARIAFFGHSKAVNQRSYTADPEVLTGLLAAVLDNDGK